ncbi:MAG: PolC-type DNA polymerase III [Clostridiales bacterium]|nr:MAG: PolC-type DNA polymerase III [Clostridiales bacterium]
MKQDKKDISILDIFSRDKDTIVEILAPNILERTELENLAQTYSELLGVGKENIIIKYNGDEINFVKTENIVSENKEQSLLDKRLQALRTNIEIEAENKAKTKRKKKEIDSRLIYKSVINQDAKPIDSTNDENSSVIYEGFVYSVDTLVTKTETQIVSFYLTDKKNAIKCKMFINPKDVSKYMGVKEGIYCKVKGMVKFDSYDKMNLLSVSAISRSEYVEQNLDISTEKRVELHMHTNMTQMSGICSVEKIVNRCKKNGYRGFAITDNSGIQSYPEAMKFQDENFKIVYGLEANVVDYNKKIADFNENISFDDTYVVFDIETTGFSPIHDKIIEIGAVKIKNREVVDRFSEFVNPERNIPEKITEITGITDDMVRNAKTIDVVLNDFNRFCENSVLAAHNSSFDMSFIKYNSKVLGLNYNEKCIDTLTLSRLVLTDIKRHGLKYICRELGVQLLNHHRAYQDAEATGYAMIKMFDKLKDMEVFDTHSLNEYAYDKIPLRDYRTNEMTVLVKEQEALSSFYKMVSSSNMGMFSKVALVKRSEIIENRNGLLIGSGGVNGELFKAIMNKYSEEQLIKIAKFYDYLEVQPFASAMNLLSDGLILNEEEYRGIINTIVKLGQKLGITVVATSNAYFLDPDEEILRDIILNSTVPFIRLQKSEPLYLMTTSDMLKEFSYLGNLKAKEIVITNTNLIFDSIGSILPIPKKTFPPIIEGSDENLRKICYSNAHRIYGENLPKQVTDRLDRELESIISNGYSVMYIVARELVIKSEKDGFMVGSRGSVGSSFAATMAGITEVNPLKPHYLCGSENCNFVEFDVNTDVLDGFDLPDKNCPKCGNALLKEGHDIPFETFLGFNGDKEPDIDLNFASIYQSDAHEYTKVLFGETFVYKAGTISTVAGKKAYGYVKKYFERIGQDLSEAFCVYLTNNLVGIKNTTGQHPGGIMVVPKNKNIHDFTPIQYPANDASKGVITTHFDYHAISGKILKLDLLGHESPTSIKILEDMTGFNALNVKFDDKNAMEVFRSSKSLGIKDASYDEDTGSLGIPEFGTMFVRQMLKDTMPNTFIELVKIAGLAHGTDVWLNNAQELVRNKTCTLLDAICTRDEIMTYLIRNGLEKFDSFSIMEKVRKGKGLSEEHESLMREKNIPDWYIESCKKIQYMFPAAHAVAYVMMSFRIAYFKVNYPLAFYGAYFSSKIADFDIPIIIKGSSSINRELNLLRSGKGNENKIYVLELAKEMLARGYNFNNVDLKQSSASQFEIVGDKLQIPFKAVKGFGEKAAEAVVEYRSKNDIYSVEDLKKINGVNKSTILSLEELGVLDKMPKTNQFTLDMFIS